MVDITVISDLHGHYPELEGGDLLIIAGDLTARDQPEQYDEFYEWLDCQPYTKKIVIAGNHDNNIDVDAIDCLRGCQYLCDSGTEFEYETYCNFCGTPKRDSNLKCQKTVMCTSETRKLKIWGSPWTKTFPNMNPKCKAFTVDTEEELAEKWALISDDIDILITHSPSYGLQDGRNSEQRLGSTSLLRFLTNSNLYKNLKLHVCGHIHEGYGMFDIRKATMELEGHSWPVYVNASHVNERYQPVNKPIRIEL